MLVYEQDRLIAAQIYPDMEYMKEKGLQEQLQEYFEGLQRKVNYNRPIYRQVGKIILRDTEFPKNTSKKILRYGINYAEREDKC